MAEVVYWPTVWYTRIVQFDHREGKAMRVLGVLPVVIVISGGCFTLSNTMSEKATEAGHLQVDAGALVTSGGALPILNARYGLAPRFDIGTRYDTMGWAFDTRLQYLTQEEHGVDSSLELGVGTAFISVFFYAGTGVAKDFGKTTPYFHVRFLHADVDRGEMSSESNSIVQDLYLTFTENLVNVAQLFFGVELDLGERWALVPEVVWVPQLDHWVQFNGALKFRF